MYRKDLMRFYLFEPRVDTYIRKSREYLEDAKVRRVEHQVATEHHSALAKMYTERISRIEAEISEALQVHSSNGQTVEAVGNGSVRLESDSVVIYPSRVSHA